MAQTGVRVYGYRWVILGAFMLTVVFNQMLWITFAPITGAAAAYYGVSDLSIGLLSMCFMIAYLFVSIPASWVIDSRGFRAAVGIGAVLTGVFGLMRGLVADRYAAVLAAQIGIAIGQPFILNAVTKVAARWFRLEERATAAGFGSLAMYLGILAGMLLTPFVTLHVGLERMLLLYGAGAAAGAIVFLALARERPPTPPGPPGEEVRALMWDGLRQALRRRQFLRLMFIFFIGLGVFNSVTTWVEDIVRPRGFGITQAGLAGGLMIVGGVIGAVVMPALSDRTRRRVPFIVWMLVLAVAGLLVLTFASSLGLLSLGSFVLGFALLSAGPIGFQYGAEIARPTPEGTSNGLLLMMGQVSGIAFIFAMDRFKVPATDSMTPSLLGLTALMLLAVVAARGLRESGLLMSPSP